MVTVAESIVEQLDVWNIDSIYGVAGDTILPHTKI
jgi:thiamine pyrophosphate-dependent acetolactate synthase large subunit-like protein